MVPIHIPVVIDGKEATALRLPPHEHCECDECGRTASLAIRHDETTIYEDLKRICEFCFLEAA